MTPRVAGDRCVVIPLAVNHQAHANLLWVYSSLFNRIRTAKEGLVWGLSKRVSLRRRRSVSSRNKDLLNYDSHVETIDTMIRLGFFPLALFFLASIGPLSQSPLWGAADQLEDIRQERTKSKQREQVNEAGRRKQLENLKRAQELDRAQRHLDDVKQRQRNRPGDQEQPQRQQQLNQIQERLDQLKNDQQLNRLQNELQLNRIQREQNEFRRQEQIRELQRDQQMQFLQDQLRKNQIRQDLNRWQQ
jgi:DNA repair exonuclease SbcCD ATPase subunit